LTYCLIVDDSAVIRKVAKRIMDGLSLRTGEAEDGEGALASCRDEMPDGLIVDCHMPGMNSCDFIKELRRLPGGDVPKVVLCTTEFDVAVVARALHAGADDYVMKPFDRPTMAAKLESCGLV
jgi:two-component system chemotaxis response regulator CheY